MKPTPSRIPIPTTKKTEHFILSVKTNASERVRFCIKLIYLSKIIIMDKLYASNLEDNEIRVKPARNTEERNG